MDDLKRRDHIADFSKHVPKLLQMQLLNEQSARYVRTQQLDPHIAELLPSIQRFHGSILFVDISGFTILSQKLDVESLKNYINGYFSQIIEIVEKWGGDVIKFAGDALYVVWQTSTGNRAANGLGTGIGSEEEKGGGGLGRSKSMRSMSMMPTFINVEFRQNTSDATNKAISCGLEICDVCGNYPVYMEGKNYPGRDGKGMFSSIVTSITSKIISRNMASDSQQPIAHLDVHCGVSVGLMAGLDVGYENRWEYFIVGEALNDVAKAEGQADKGDVVISRSAHEFSHPGSNFPFSQEDGENDNDQYSSQKLLSCGCCVLFNDCFRVQAINNSSIPGNAKLLKNKSMTQLRPRKSVVGIDIKKENQKLYETFSAEVKAALMVITPLLKKEYATYIMRITEDSGECETRNDVIIQKVKQLDKLLPTFIHSKVRRHLSTWLEQTLIDHLARHVHDVAREGYTIASNSHLEPFRVLLESFFTSIQNKSSNITQSFSSTSNADNIEIERIRKPISIHPGSSSAFNYSLQTAKTTVSANDEDHSELDEMYDGKVTSKDGSKFQGKSFYQSSVDAEMRNVTVMFIKIDSFDMSLLIDASQMKENKKFAQKYDASYGFLERTENEQMADKMIVDRLQCCLEVLHRSIYSHGGQLRQFIVDDKGTVCIASFGLRGAVNDDNAANAMEAANEIIKELEKQGLNASIGITTGKVYCGLVGSNLRHEYAIMGPSVNLSARLMSKARFGTILCDQETKNSDRAHTFKHKGEIVAKGYAQPVSTYSPSFGDSVHLDYHDNSMDDYSILYAPADSFIGDGEDSGMISKQSGAVSNPDLSKRQRTSALRFSIAVDAPQIHSIRSKLIKETTSHERLVGLIESEFVFTDEINGGRGNDGNNNLISSSIIEKSGKFTGFRTLHGRAAEIERILYFMFEEGGQDGFSLANFEAQPRLVVVIGSGGAGKTALFSAIGQKLFSAAKTDSGCNVVVLSNRMSQLIASARQNPWRPILIELVRSLKKAYELQSLIELGSGVSLKQVARKHRSNMRMLVKQDSIREYSIVIDNLFSQLDPNLLPLKTILTDLMGITSPTTPEITGTTIMMNAVQQEKVQQFKTLMVAVVNHYTSFVKKALVIIIEDVNTIDKASSDVLKYAWENAKGVHFLLSSSTSSIGMSSGNASPLKANTSTRGSPPPMQHAGSRLTSVRQNSIFASLENNPRYLQLELQPLTKDASIAIAEDILGDEFPAPLKKAISSSGGNPLYIVQMASSMIIDGTSPIAMAMGSAAAEVNNMPDAKNALSEKEAILSITQQSIADLNTMANMKRRVEEIICYRLDQLDGFTQMVLKAATVAAANGKSFSVKLIAFMINGNSKMLLKLSASIFPTLFGNDGNLLGSDHSTTTATVLDGHQPMAHPMRIDLRTRERMVSHILQTLINNGDFIQLKMLGDDSEKGKPATSPISQKGNEVDGVILLKGDEAIEFQIATEQSTIYSLIVDEQREYFHGKVSQYYHQQWLTCSHQMEVDVALGDMLNIAYHAEQAALWPLALRAFLQSSIFEHSEYKVKEFMASILECYKIFRCFEQESGTSIVPYVISEIMSQKELVQRILTHKKLPGDELDTLTKQFEQDLDGVYDVFGLDRASIVFAARVHLYLADFYLSGFYDVSLAEQMLGTALKLMLAVRLCEDFHDHDAVHGVDIQGDAEHDFIHLPTAAVADAASKGDTTDTYNPESASKAPSQDHNHQKSLHLSSLHSAKSLEVSTVLEDADVCHFYSTYFAWIHSVPLPGMDLKSSSNKNDIPNNAPKDSHVALSQEIDYVPSESLRDFFLSTKADASWYGMQVIHSLRLRRFNEAISIWKEIPSCSSASVLYYETLRFGVDIGLLATSSLLQSVASIGGKETNHLEYDSVIADCIARISKYIELYNGSMIIFHAITPAIAPMALLGQWRTLITWFKLIGNNSRYTHDILGAQNALYKHLYRWLRAIYHVYLQMNYGALISTTETDTTVVVVPTLTELKHSLDYFSSQGGVLKSRCSGSKALEQFMKMIQPTMAMNVRHLGLVPETICMQLLFAAFFLNRERILNDAGGLLEFENRFSSLNSLFLQYYQTLFVSITTNCRSMLVESSILSFAVNMNILMPVITANVKCRPVLSSSDLRLHESLVPSSEHHAINVILQQLLSFVGNDTTASNSCAHAQNLKQILSSFLFPAV